MSYPIYYVEAGDTLPIFFDTFDGGDGSSITMTGLAVTDIEIYKDGSVTQRSSDAGYTLLDTDGIDFDGITGIHGFSIDLSDNTDSGFFSVGSWYHVVVSSVTVDSQTVSFIAAAFRIVSATRGMAGTALPDAAADAAGGLVISDAGGLDIDGMNTNVSSILTDTAEIGAAGAGLTEAGGNGDHLTEVALADGAIDEASIASAALTSAKVGTGFLTSNGLATSATNEIRDAILADSTAFNGADVAAIVADTNELQTDWANGGRLDLLIDAIKAETDKLDAAHSEPTGVPAANETPLDKLAYIFMALRNQVDVTATKKTFYDDGGSAEWEKDLSDNGTTYSESEANAI